MLAMAYGLLAMSLNLLIGYAGLVSFGHAMFFASGAYTFGLAMQSGKFSSRRPLHWPSSSPRCWR